MGKSLTIVYPSGAGGEFLGWLFGQCHGFVPQQVSIKPDINKWDTPGHQWMHDLDCKIFLERKFDKELINVFRDHCWCSILDREYLELKESIDRFVYTRYDMWDESCFIILCPTTKKSVEMVNKLSLYKLQEGIGKQYLEDETWGIKITEKILKNRHYIIVDPVDLYYNNTEQELQKINSYLIEHKLFFHSIANLYTNQSFGKQVTTQFNFFIEIWRDNNPNGLFD